MDDVTQLGVDIDGPDIRSVTDERATLPAVELDRWLTGYRLLGTMASWRRQFESPGPDALLPDSVRVRVGADLAQEDIDYAVEPRWGVLSSKSGLTARSEASIDYSYSLRRVDSVVRDPAGVTSVVRGLSDLMVPRPPELPPELVHLANVFVPSRSDSRGPMVFPIPTARSLITPRASTIGLDDARSRLHEGRALRVTCLGDSVTGGCDASTDSSAFPALLASRLSRHPARPIVDVSTVAVGGSTTADWLGDTRRDCDWSLVEASEPDVVIVEFVNDAGLQLDQLAENYSEINRRVSAVGASLVLTTPHWVMPEWMSFTQDGSDDRPYVRFLREFSSANGIALADVSRSWQQLGEQGIHYETLLQNGINHPDDRGHELAAASISSCFV